MSTMLGSEVCEDGFSDSTGDPYYPFPNSTSMGGMRRIKNPFATFIGQIGLDQAVIHLFEAGLKLVSCSLKIGSAVRTELYCWSPQSEKSSERIDET